MGNHERDGSVQSGPHVQVVFENVQIVQPVRFTAHGALQRQRVGVLRYAVHVAEVYEGGVQPYRLRTW